jgi:predicted O-linked N-acetylglucosamine transferase (SPINDLY family)
LQNTVGSRAFQNARLQKKLKKQSEVLLPAALAAYREGRHADAQAICSRVLHDLPDHFDAQHLLGVSQLDSGRFEEARQTLERAIAIDQRSAEAFSNFGMALFKLRRYEEARVYQERAIALKPTFAMAQTNLGNTLLRLGQVEQAIEAHERAIRLKPDYADAYCNRGMAELMLKRYEKAAQCFDRTLSFQPRHLEAIVGKGLVSIELRHFDEAYELLTIALAASPNMPEILAHRGRLHLHFGRFDEAQTDFDAALALSPDLELAWRGRAQLGTLRNNTAQAIFACNKVLEKNPRSEIAITLLGACFASQGEVVSAIDHFDRALEIKPDYEDAITKKIFTLDFLPEAGFEIQQAARKYWWDAIGSALPRQALVARPLDPQKRIVVGYVSSDFRSHSAAFAFLPVLKNHDRSNFQINCYSCSPIRDAVTTKFQSLVDVWVDALRLSDDELANRICADGVDILVDLSGHSAGNRLAVFARKPAPIQVTAWGHAAGTGVPTIDYFFADPVTVPEAARRFFVEKIYDLPCLITMDPILHLYPSALPIIQNGYVTFGVFNRVDKISEGALALWVRLLRSIAGSKIVVKHGALDDLLLRDGLIARFAAHGISEERVVCLGSTIRDQHLRAFESIDIALDPFPQNGGISSWEALYMGVPIVAKMGNGASSRITAAILKALGLDDWVADDDESYFSIAQKFAAMPSYLERLRAELPARIASSPSGNVEVYTRAVEEGYRLFWTEYCSSEAAR